MRCPSCASELQAGSRFCPSCGQPIGSSSQFTTGAGALSAVATRASAPNAHATSPGGIVHGINRLSSESIPVGGLTPDSVLAGRYRIVGLLGRGGMGEVYRADDMKLWTLFISSPMTLQTSAWYSSAGYASLLIVGAIAVYGFKTALAGRPILKDPALAE